MRNSYKKKVTLKTKFPPALSHHFLLDQQKIQTCILRKFRFENIDFEILKTQTRNTAENIENHRATNETNQCKKPTTIQERWHMQEHI